MTFVHRPNLEYRLSFARLDGLTSFQNSSYPTDGPRLPSSLSGGTSMGSAAASASPRFETTATSSSSAASNFISYGDRVQSNYRNGGTEVPMTVSSSVGSHSYRENRPSYTGTGTGTSGSSNSNSNNNGNSNSNSNGNSNGNIYRSNRDRSSSSNSSPYRGRDSRSPSTGSPDVIFSSGYDSHRNSQRGSSSTSSSSSRESSTYTGERQDRSDRDRDRKDRDWDRDRERDGNRESSYRNDKSDTRSWKSKSASDSASSGIESTQDYPSSFCRTVAYDHLATSSLEGIEALPHIKFSKGRTYLSRWWNAAKKWDLLDDELKLIDETFKLRIALATTAPVTLVKNTATGSGSVSSDRDRDRERGGENSQSQSSTQSTFFSTPSTTTTAAQDVENRIKTETSRISAVLNSLIGKNTESDLGSMSTSTSQNTQNSQNSDPNNLQSNLNSLKFSNNLAIGPKILGKNGLENNFLNTVSKSADNAVDNKINELIAKTIQNVISFESETQKNIQNNDNILTEKFSGNIVIDDRSSVSGSDLVSLLGGTVKTVDMGNEIGKDKINEKSKSWGSGSSSVGYQNTVSTSTGAEVNYRDSGRDVMSGSNERENDLESEYYLGNTGGNRRSRRANDALSNSWNPYKKDENEDSAYDHASPDTDMSVPIEELYRLCDTHKARVICIGDVHGCVEELKDLLRVVKYRPGDLVLLLGDLVAKG